MPIIYRNRRANKVYLTAQGRALRPEIRQGLKQWAELVTTGFLASEADQAYRFLERMARTVIDGKVRLGPQTKFHQRWYI